MKLLLCIQCQDVKRLMRTRVECGCGAAWANLINYDDKDNHVAANENALIIGMDDAQLKETMQRMTAFPQSSHRLPMFLLPEPCKSVHRLVESPRVDRAKGASDQGRLSTKRARRC